MATRKEMAKAELERRGIMRYVEPMLTIGTAAIAEPLSGLSGLAAMPFGAETASRVVGRTQDFLTYQPKTQEGREGAQALASAIEPVAEYLSMPSNYLGESVYEATGSPALAAAAYSAPTAALELLGLKGLRSASKAGKLGAQLEVGDLGRGGPMSKQRGAIPGLKKSDEKWYHGTMDSDFDDFDLEYFGENYGTYGEPAIYHTSSKSHARQYGPEIKENTIDTSNYKIVDMDEAMQETYRYFNEGESYADWIGEREGIFEALDFDQYIGNEAKRAKKAGYKGVIADFSKIPDERAQDIGKISLSFDPSIIK